MKNLKKVLALVVAFSMMLCSVALAAFPDVEEGADYEVAVNTLAALGIISGDDQGNFNPDNSITRAEFTKIVCEIQGLKGDANKGATAFTDVAADHWASGYINMATNLKIINGMGDGTFAPEAPVTYEQAIKMLVVTLGYAPMAADRGGFPTGHLVVAQTYGMTKNISAPAQAEAAKRSLIAQIVYNTIDTPMMEQTGFGSNITYEVKDGKGDRERVTLLTSKFDVAKLGGVVLSNEKITLVEDGEIADKGEIDLKVTNNFKSSDEAFKLDVESESGDYTIISGISVGETNAADYLGLGVIAYVRDNGSEDYEVIAIVPEEGKNASVKLSYTDIDEDESQTDPTEKGYAIAYYKENGSVAKYRLEGAEEDAEVAIIWNDQNDEAHDTVAELVAEAVAGKVSAELELIDWDNNGKYDLIKGVSYKHFLVSEIDDEDFIIKTKEGNKFNLDEEENEDVIITIKNAKGEALSFEDIKVGDVIAVNADNLKSPELFLDIIVLGESSVTGVVKSTRNSGTEIKIDGTWYEIDAAYDKTFALGSEGTFYIGSNGKIINFDGTRAAAGDFGFIIQAGEVEADAVFEGEGENVWQLKILDAKGQVGIYEIVDEVEFVNNSGEEPEYDEATFADDDTTVEAGFFDNTVFEGLIDEETSLEDILKNFSKLNAGATKTQRLIQFKANADNVITELGPVYGLTTETTEAFDADDLDIGAVEMDSATVIFNAKGSNEDAKTVSLDSLLSDAKYTVYGFCPDEDTDIFGGVLITAGGASLTTSVEGFAVVLDEPAQEEDEDEDKTYVLEVVENGSSTKKVITVTKDTEVDSAYNAGYSEKTGVDLVDKAGLGAGSIILYAANAEGVVETIAVLAKVDGAKFVKVGDLSEKEAGTEYATTFVLGKLADEADSSFTVTNELDDNKAAALKIRTTTNEYRYAKSGRTETINVGSYNGGKVDGFDKDDEDDKNTNYVFARLVNNKVADIISIDTRIAK